MADVEKRKSGLGISTLVHKEPLVDDDPEFSFERHGVREAIDNLEAAFGGRQRLCAAISASADPEAEYLLGLIADPRNDRKKLSTLCYQTSISPAALLRLYRGAAMARAQVLAIHEVADAGQPVARDVMRRAQNHYRLCEKCHGIGCEACGGSGELLVDASLEHQKLALDMLGLLPKPGSAPITQVNQFAAPAGEVLPFASLQLAVQQILSEPRVPLPTVEVAEVVDERTEQPVAADAAAGDRPAGDVSVVDGPVR